MLRLIAPQTMLSCEKEWFRQSGIPSIRVMERAATCLAESLLRHFEDPQRVYFACGPGGNGGDGYACARILRTHAGIDCAIVRSAPASSPDCVENASLAAQSGIPILNVEDMDSMPVPDVWVDCLYGTGLSRAPEGSAANIIRRIEHDTRFGAKVLACDIPSGLNGQTGIAYDPCVRADVTCALQLAKYGHFLADGLDLCGELDIPDIGFPETAFPAQLPVLVDPEDLRGFFSPRPRNIHKNRCGHLLIIAGSIGMAGAASLCAKGALRGGVGLVTIACVDAIVPILQTLAPCAMCVPLPSANGALTDDAAEMIHNLLPGKTAIAVGPGLSRGASAKVLQTILESDLPAVIDADALNILSEHPELQCQLTSRHVLTPHPGEAARLIGHPIKDPIEDSASLARLGASIVLKGASRVIRDNDQCLISVTGSCGMARGGSGDILTGILGALLAENSDRTPAQSAVCACELHGVAGALAAEQFGDRSMNAADILDFLPEAFKRYA